MLMVFQCMKFHNLIIPSPVDGHLVCLQLLCQGVRADVSTHGQESGRRGFLSFLSRGVLELQCT